MNKVKKLLCSVTAVAALITGGVTVTDADYNKAIGQVEINDLILGDIKVSPHALDLIGNAEGCRRDPYRCPSGLITNGIGNTHGVIQTQASDAQVAKDWVENIQSAEQCLYDWKSDLPLSQGQVDALTSFIFNTGCTRFRYNRDGSETRIGYFVKTGQYALACHQLNRWIYGGGAKLSGLVTRRQKETEICLSKDG